MINRIVKWTVPFVAIASLSGCVPHLTQAQCKSMNWYQVGFNDGQQGKYQRSLNQAISDCARFKLTVNTKSYAKGWRAGTRKYCRPNNGYRLGTNGMRYNDVCPDNMAGQFNRAWHRGLRRYCVPATGYNLGRSGKGFPDFCAPDQVNQFRNAYDRGMRIYRRQRDLQGDLNNVNSEIGNINNTIANNRANIRSWQNELDNGVPGKTPRIRHKRRRELRDDIRNARGRIADLQDRLSQLYRERSRYQRQLNRVSAE